MGDGPDTPNNGAREARGAPLIATRLRWGASTAALAVAAVLAVEAYLSVWRSPRSIASFAGPIGAMVAVFGVLLWITLRGEELRLARELRTARTGTPAVRAMVAGRRRAGSALSRWFTTRLGTAAVVLADGDRAQALELLSGSSALMRGGRLDRLQAVVNADVERAAGSASAVAHCISTLRSLAPLGNREADLYRTHVLVKAVLEQGDLETAKELCAGLASSPDEEQRVYVIWLRTWFELDGDTDPGSPRWQPPSEGELRMAALLARAHGATKLVERLEDLVTAAAAIADATARK